MKIGPIIVTFLSLTLAFARFLKEAGFPSSATCPVDHSQLQVVTLSAEHAEEFRAT
jgi:hypothetical protein